jgi:hypothetical protein
LGSGGKGIGSGKKYHEDHEGNAKSYSYLFSMFFMLSRVNISPILNKLPDGLDFVIHHLLSEARESPEEEGLVHDGVSTSHLTHNTEGIRAILAELDKDGLAEKVASEEHPVANFIRIKMKG